MLRVHLFAGVAWLATVVALPVSGGETQARPRTEPADAQDLISAEAAGLVEVRFIPNDARSAQVVVINRSDKPLTLRIPAGFAGVPVLAQMLGGGMGGGGGVNGFGAGGTPLSVGGGMGGGMGGGIGGGLGGGGLGGVPFSLPPERTRTLRVPTVCLEYGKREPTPRIPYRMMPLETCSTDPRLQDVMDTMASGAITQKVAQAAAWHITSGRSWDQLAAEMIAMAGGDPDVPFFTPAELAAARTVVDRATQRHPVAAPATSESASR
jgi:hypothetical protein